MFFKIHDMTQCILSVEIYIKNIGQCHNIFNVLYVVKSALNTVCVLYIYWNITQRDAGNQLYSFSMWVYHKFYKFFASYSTKLFFFSFFLLSLVFFLSCLLLCLCSFSSFPAFSYFCFLALFLDFTSASLEPGKCWSINKKRLHNFLLFTFLLAMPMNQVAPGRLQVWLNWPCL